MKNKEINNERLLSLKDVKKCYWSWMFWTLSAQNMERMEAPALIRMVGIVKDKLYPGDLEKQKELLERHEPFFNTEPYLGCIVPGVVLGMEEENARGQGAIPSDMINGIKTALMGPFAGIGDSLYVGTLIPIMLSICLGLSSTTGSVLGPLLYIVLNLGIMIPLTWYLYKSGYNMGINAAQHILIGGLKDKITSAMNIIGLVVVGAITSQYVTVNTGLVFTQGNMKISLSETINGLFPNAISLLLAFMSYYLLSSKKVSIGWLFLILFGLAVVGYFTKIISV
jgi:mannose/fructose/N-acetylgalactosamine-specific phosphotransferase system component IID